MLARGIGDGPLRPPRWLLISYLLAVLASVLYVPWVTVLDRGLRRTDPYSLLWEPPSGLAIVDITRLILTLVAVTVLFLILWLAPRPRRGRGSPTRPLETEITHKRLTRGAVQPVRWKRWVGWYLALSGLFGLWGAQRAGLTVIAVLGLFTFVGLRWIVLNPPPDGYLIARIWDQLGALMRRR
ncbi:MAG TPA: hypothetical protein DDZ42_17200 [Candidatus Rokubacteria bacterium]|nr:MAG: hypothetical protein A2V63_04180 [Candidatus Eisenbacteria bacterium RBG_19FT_COMBO_70_11]OGK77347.1 MAG: hypothetical protein A2050_03160 [Candidatus Rokubacteria bacterium GWA2_73_35]HBH03629.1 hypothetical protein [Candidatus Rokubacteria bacterium]